MKLNQVSALIIAFTILATYIALNNGSQNVSQYIKWKNQYKYPIVSQAQDRFRKYIFDSNINQINIHNSNPSRTYNMGINQFTGLTQQEFVSSYLMNIIIDEPLKIEQNKNFIMESQEIDWVAIGAVTGVKSQGQCSSCWAFSTVGSIEGIKQITTGKLTSLSTQQLIDCSAKYGNFGCGGGRFSSSYTYVKDKGLVSDSSYPYKGVKQDCKIPPAAQLFKINSFASVTSCPDLSAQILHQPIAVLVDGTQWNNYYNGVFNKCGGTNLNLGVLLVGFVGGAWKVKSSWGDSWGQHGYIRLDAKFNSGNCCGICNAGAYPIPYLNNQ